MSLRAEIETSPLGPMTEAALGEQSWLCQPMSTESAQPTFALPRMIWHALVRIWPMMFIVVASELPVIFERASSWAGGTSHGFACSEPSSSAGSLVAHHSPTDGWVVTL